MFKNLHAALSFTLITAFIGSSLYVPQSRAGEMVAPIMPTPGTMVQLSPEYTPAYLKGIVIHPDNALKFDFLVHKGEGELDENQKTQEYTKLIKYFLASLTVPDRDQWVNLSPYEKNRIVANDFGNTMMGRDLLTQDYLLKQITSSLMYPESNLGKVFWNKVYERAHQEFGTTDIPVNTFNKVWIVPDDALIYESGNTAYVVKSHLKVMLEEDYLSLEKHTAIENPDPKQNALHSVSSKIIKEVILPEIEREVNEGKNFAMLRQIFSGMVLASWYKNALRESLLGQVYADKARVLGVNQNPRNNQVIYRKYLAAFKKGVYNYIKEDTDRYTNEIIPRKYFAGGFIDDAAQVTRIAQVPESALADAMNNDNSQSSEDLAQVVVDQAQASRPVNPEAPNLKDIDRTIDNLAFNLAGVIPIKEPGNNGRFYVQWTVQRPLTQIEKDRMEAILKGAKPGLNIGFEEVSRSYTRFERTIQYINTIVKIDYPDNSMRADNAQLTHDAAMSASQSAATTKPVRIVLNGAGVRRAQDQGWSDLLKRDGKLIYVSGQTTGVPNNRAIRFDIAPNTHLTMPISGIEKILPDEAMDKAMAAKAQPIIEDVDIKRAMKEVGSIILHSDRAESEIEVAIGQLNVMSRHNSDNVLVREFEEIYDRFSTEIGPIAFYLGPNQSDIDEYRWVPKQTRTQRLQLVAVNGVPVERADSVMTKGGIDLNSANLSMVIKRDGRGVPLPLAQQDLAQLGQIRGFVPRILEIRPVSSLPIFNDKP